MRGGVRIKSTWEDECRLAAAYINFLNDGEEQWQRIAWFDIDRIEYKDEHTSYAKITIVYLARYNIGNNKINQETRSYMSSVSEYEKWQRNTHGSTSDFAARLRKLEPQDDVLDPIKHGTQELDPLGGSGVTTRTWESVRTNAIRKAGERRGNRNPTISVTTTGHITCDCIERAKHPMCAHMAALILQGRDRPDILDKFQKFTKLYVPIGLGKYWYPAEFRPSEQLADFVDVVYTGFQDHVYEEMLLGPGEGMLSFIKYVEDYLRTYPEYALMTHWNMQECITYVNQYCVRAAKHTHFNQAMNMQGFREHDDRDNFIIATVAALRFDDVCVPCAVNKSGAEDIPDL